MSTEEVSSLLVQVGLFDKAITIVQSFSLPLAPVFEALATRFEKLECLIYTEDRVRPIKHHKPIQQDL